jgi:sulfur-oxidizing protein SoxA
MEEHYMRIINLISLAAVTLVLGLNITVAEAAKKPVIKAQPGNPLGEIYSGYNMRDPKTQAMQDDDFENPGMLWVEQGADLWNKVDGKAGKSCASCHNEAEKSMKGVGAKYPVYREDLKSVQNLELKINECRTKQMQAKPWKYESNEMMGTAAFIKFQSRGMPVNVTIKGEGAKAKFELGKKFYYQRRGQLDMSCANCHEQHQGVHIRSDYLTQGQSNGFPTFRLKWQKMGTLHRRFKGCNKNIRAKPYKRGSQEYLNLEYYLGWRGNGLPVETPSVRN